MTSADTKQGLEFFASCVVYVAGISRANGKNAIGTAFHIGDGYYATARHVVEDMEVSEIGRPDVSQKTRFIAEPVAFHRGSTHRSFAVDASAIVPQFHPDEKVDLAVFRLGPRLPVRVPLSLLVDQVTEGELLLEDVLVLGFPPIAQANAAYFVALRAEVSSVVQTYTDARRYLVLSGMARGGFSGGPVIGMPALGHSARWSGLGIVSRALLEGEQSTELGFMSALTPLPVFELLDFHKIRINDLSEEQHQAKMILAQRKKEQSRKELST